MRIVVIGATGHVGGYLVPHLVEAGHEVLALSRGQRQPYRPHSAWQRVQMLTVDRAAEEAQEAFGAHIADLAPDVVVDMIAFQPESVRQLADALRGRVQHYLCCGTIWVHGPSVAVPCAEEESRQPFGEYGIQKAAIEDYLLGEARRGDLPATVVHPGHIVGPGWVPINPQGNLNLRVFEALARGQELALPHLGMETLHHVHAEDVAQVFWRAIERWSSAVGQSFHAVSPAALTLRGYAESVAGWFGQAAALRFLPWEAWRELVGEHDAAVTYDHIAHSPNCSIARAQALLGYQPRYTSLEAVHEALAWLIEQGQVQAPRLR